MGRLFAVFLLIFPASPLWAMCAGTDLIARLDASDLGVLETRAQNTAYGKGIFWRATKGSSKITLFGTYHFHHAQTEAHLELLKPYMDSADAIFLEVSTGDQKQLQREIVADPSLMFIVEGETLPDLLGPTDWKKLVEEMRARAIPGFMVAKFKPFWAAMMLGVGPCETRNGLTAGKGIDEQIGHYAASIGNDSRSLEDYRTVLTLFDKFSLEDQLDMIRLFFAWADQADDISYTLLMHYLDQEIALIWEYSRLISLQYGGDNAMDDFELFERQLLINRNAGWMDVILKAAPDKTLFLAAGAGHLPGETGLLRLLEKQGYAITRLPLEP
jgi:uncharacterized protein YbaP (TraB family)